MPPHAPIDVVMNFDARCCSILVRVGDGEVMMSPDGTRTFGQQLIGAATEAEIQRLLIDWFTRHVGPLDVEQGTALAMQFRQYLAAQRHPGRE